MTKWQSEYAYGGNYACKGCQYSDGKICWDCSGTGQTDTGNGGDVACECIPCGEWRAEKVKAMRAIEEYERKKAQEREPKEPI